MVLQHLFVLYVKEINMDKRKPYTTKSRTEILDYIKQNSSKAISVSDILNYFKDKGESINQTTVYRYLEKLCQDRVIIKYPDKSGEKSVYQLNDENCDCINHLHLKCTECGKIIHMDCSYVEDFKEHLQKDHDFVVTYNGNILYGVCKDCIDKNKKDKNSH